MAYMDFNVGDHGYKSTFPIAMCTPDCIRFKVLSTFITNQVHVAAKVVENNRRAVVSVEKFSRTMGKLTY
jgi:hypothetical protein